MRKLFTIVMLASLTGCFDKPQETQDAETQDSKTPDPKTAPVSKIDFDDPETRKKIAAEAIYKNQSQRRGNKGEELVYFRDQQTPYTGWWKEMRGKGNGYNFAQLVQYKNGKIDGPMAQWYKNGQKRREATYRDGEKMFTSSWHENGQKKYIHYYKDNKPDGLWTEWNGNGQKKSEITYKGGKKHGLQMWWYDNGQKTAETTWKDGKLMSAVKWKPNGEKCPVTNVVDGNGVKVDYNIKDGTEIRRGTYREGELVSD